jgi:hypothetical protein
VDHEEHVVNRDFFFDVFGLRWGFQYSPIVHQSGPYMTRFIVFLGWVNLRLHKFYRGDHDRASHTHPWWFVTFPFTSYQEWVYRKGELVESRIVSAWRFHFRPTGFEHVVKYALDSAVHPYLGFPMWKKRTKPFWTFVIAGGKAASWGFYKPDGTYIPWRDYDGAEE